MSNEKKAVEEKPDYSTWNIFKKLAEARVLIRGMMGTKSGFNKYANYRYFELEDIHIAPNNVQSGYTSHCGAYFCGTYTPIAAGNWMKVGDADAIYGLNADGTIVKIDEETGINGFRAYFNLQEGTEATALHIFDSPDAINVIPVSKEDGTIYNLAGQRFSKPIKGINIIKGKKVATNKN